MKHEMAKKKDWRLTNQETYLKGATLVHRKYRPYEKNPNSDHAHCAFCWAKFYVKDCAGSIQEGYATQDDYHWICPQCFSDFKDQFAWKVIEATNNTGPRSG